MDVGDPLLMSSRSWRWLRERILGLLDRPVSFDAAGQPVFANRLQHHLYAPAVQARQHITR